MVFLDYPRFKHRGILVDTARHFLPLDTLYEVLEGMSMNKFNVMHWHIVDEQRFLPIHRFSNYRNAQTCCNWKI